MPKSWQYPRWRRYVMQLVLWVVLAGTVALAALVGHRKTAMQRIELAPAVTYGEVAVALPKGWAVAQGTEEKPLELVEAKEGNDEDKETRGRTLSVLHQRTTELMSPVEYLTRMGVKIERRAEAIGNSNFRAGFIETTVAGHVGVLVVGVRVVRPAQGFEGEMQWQKEVLACAVLPSYGAITVKLEGYGVADQSDIELVRRVAGAIVLKGDTAATTIANDGGQTIELPGGTRATTPQGFRVASTPDVNATNRQLIRDATLAQWAAIDLVPCVFFPSDTKETLTTMLAQRDARWRVSPVRVEKEGWLRVDSVVDLPQFPSRAYLVADKSGHALLAIFRGGGSGDEAFEPVWQAIVKSVKFPESNDYAAMLAAGADESQRLCDEGLDKLLGDDRAEEWWLWYRETPEHYIGWTSLRYDDPSRWRATRESRLRIPTRRLQRATQAWEASDDLRTYRALIAHSEAGGGPDQRFADVIKESINLKDQKIGLMMSTGGVTLPAGQMSAPPQYVPGAVLPLLVGKLSGKPMILKSESFVGSEGDAGPGLLTLIIRPSEEFPRTAEGDDKPMRCVTIEVNGTGGISRWYFRADGTLESIDMPDGLHRVRSDLQQIRLDFGDDVRMVP